jgi:hypothetical protein
MALLAICRGRKIPVRRAVDRKLAMTYLQSPKASVRTEQQYAGAEQKIDQALESARLVVFLGFGYHPKHSEETCFVFSTFLVSR